MTHHRFHRFLTVDLKAFFLHLRLHYQFLILSGAFLMGGILVENRNYLHFWIFFFLVHGLLFAGVTAYNSYWDKDSGPIGGLEHPPTMKPWMLLASWLLQIVGFIASVTINLLATITYIISAVFFYFYSSPEWRWKGHPFLSLLAIGISTGIGSFLMGFFSAGGQHISWQVIALALGTCISLLSLYPLSQLYQIQEDAQRQDRTFAVVFGKAGITQFFCLSFCIGSILTSVVVSQLNIFLAILYLGGAIVMATLGWKVISSCLGLPSDYRLIMRLKYLAGGLFSLFALLSFWITAAQ